MSLKNNDYILVGFGRKKKKEKLKKTLKKNICPICNKKITKPNTWVKYHIRYNPPIVILACKYCNYTEYCLRTSQKGGRSLSKIRVRKIIELHKKFNIEL